MHSLSPPPRGGIDECLLSQSLQDLEINEWGGGVGRGWARGVGGGLGGALVAHLLQNGSGVNLVVHLFLGLF